MTKEMVITSFIASASRVYANKKYVILSNNPHEHELVSQSQQGFMQYLSTVVEQYFEQNKQANEDFNPIDWYKNSLEKSIENYFREDKQMISEYMTGVAQIEDALDLQIFTSIPNHSDREFSWTDYSTKDEDFQLWQNNLTNYFGQDKFDIRTGKMIIDDGAEKELIGFCPAVTVAKYMVNTGYKLIADYLKQKSLDSS